MDIIAKTSQYLGFDELKKGDIFALLAEGEFYFKNGEFYMKCCDDSAVRLTTGDIIRFKATALCELIDCVLVEKEIYTKLTEK